MTSSICRDDHCMCWIRWSHCCRCQAFEDALLFTSHMGDFMAQTHYRRGQDSMKPAFAIQAHLPEHTGSLGIILPTRPEICGTEAIERGAEGALQTLWYMHRAILSIRDRVVPGAVVTYDGDDEYEVDRVLPGNTAELRNIDSDIVRIAPVERCAVLADVPPPEVAHRENGQMGLGL